MKKTKEVVGVVPVKGESERVRNKNLKPFGGTNIFELKLSQLQKVKGHNGLVDIVISSEDPDILETARQAGYSVHDRDPKFSTSLVPMSDVYSYIGTEVSGDHVAWINVTNPLAESEIYIKALKEYQELPNEYDCLLSVYEIQDNIIFRGKPLNFPRRPWPRSQDLEPVLAMSFVINILRREDLVRWGSCVGERPYFYTLPQIDSWDIDFQADFDFCESAYKERRNIK